MRASPVCLALVAGVALVAMPAAATARPKVAVLGLEVSDGGAAVDARTTGAARAITKALREEAQRDKTRFEIAPDSSKDLLELKLLSDCSDEGRRCMADIGKELKADFLIYGKVEKQPQGYQVSLKLLDTAGAQMVKTTSDIVPFAEASGRGATTWGRSFYARLTGTPEDGALIVSANVDAGMVYIDGELATNLAGGTARIAGVSAGIHRLSVQADGFLRHDAEVTIVAGQQQELSVTLVAETSGVIDDGEGDGDAVGPGGKWRAAFWIAAGATAVSATAWSIEAYRYSGLWGLADAPLKQDHIEAVDDLNVLLDRAGEPQLGPSVDACAGAEPYAAGDDPDLRDAARAVGDACDRGSFHASMTTVLGVATGVSAIASVFFYYKGYVATGAGRRSEHATARRADRPRERAPMVRFVPAIGPTSVSGGLAIEF